MANISTSLNNLKRKADYLDVGELKNVLVEMKKSSDAVDNEVAKNTNFNTLKPKIWK